MTAINSTMFDTPNRGNQSSNINLLTPEWVNIAYQVNDSLLAGGESVKVDTLLSILNLTSSYSQSDKLSSGYLANILAQYSVNILTLQSAKTLADVSEKIYVNQSRKYFLGQSAKHFANLKRGEFTPFAKGDFSHLSKVGKSRYLSSVIEFCQSIKKGNHKDDEFTPIKGFEDYLINKNGQLISIKFNKIKKLNPSLDVYGYEKVTLSMNGKPKSCLVHRLVAETFLLNSQNKRDVNHLNGDKTDNRLCNLEWATPKENTEHAWATGLNNSRFKPIKQLDINGKLIRTFKSAKDAESVLSICRGDIAKVCKGKQKSAGGYKWSYL